MVLVVLRMRKFREFMYSVRYELGDFKMGLTRQGSGCGFAEVNA